MNKGIWLTTALCCVYPVVFYLVATYGLKFLKGRDWRHVDWSEFLSEINPWRKRE